MPVTALTSSRHRHDAVSARLIHLLAVPGGLNYFSPFFQFPPLPIFSYCFRQKRAR